MLESTITGYCIIDKAYLCFQAGMPCLFITDRTFCSTFMQSGSDGQRERGSFMKKIGLITVGQAPRDDVTVDLLPIFGSDIELIQVGALDGLTREEIAAFAPEEGDYVLVSRLNDGSSAVFAERYILPRLQQCIFDLEKADVALILFLCTGSFPTFQSRVPIIYPCNVMNGLVPALTNRSRIAVITPKKEQLEQCADKWADYVSSVQVTFGTPYGDIAEVEKAAREVVAMDVDLVVLDCIGYTSAMKETVRKITGIPVVLSRTLAARAVMELLT